MTDQAVSRKSRASDEKRQGLSISLAPALIDTLDGLRDFPGQYRSEIIGRLIVDEARRRGIAVES